MSNASLRDLYTIPSSSWSFLPPPDNPSAPGPSTPSSSAATVHTFTTRPAPNTLFDFGGVTATGEELGPGVQLTIIARGLVAAALTQYASTAIAMPWEAAKTLLQVQWVPRDAGETTTDAGSVTLAGTDTTMVGAEDVSSDDDSSETEAYFADPNRPGSTPRPHAYQTDEEGYVLRPNIMDESTRPAYLIPVGSADGVWGMMKRLGRFRGEGWPSLWKGLLTTCVQDAVATTVQPVFSSLIQYIFFPSLQPFMPPPLLLPVTSHLLTGLLVSPLDLIRTRLIVQPRTAERRAYTGPIDAFDQILRDEGGLKGICLHPQLLIPAALDSALRPFLAIALPRLVARTFRLNEELHPVATLAAEFVGSCAALLVTLPFETIRRRLQVQPRGKAKQMRTCVEVRPRSYNGVVDAFWHILTEERSDLPIDRSRDEDSWWRSTGLGQLYRGLGMRLGASCIILVLGILTGGDSPDAGWTEL